MPEVKNTFLLMLLKDRTLRFFVQTQPYFGSVVEHRRAFDGVADNLMHLLAVPPFADWPKDRL